MNDPITQCAETLEEVAVARPLRAEVREFGLNALLEGDIMSKILASMLAAGFVLGINATMAEDTNKDATAWTDCDTLAGQDRVLCQKSSEFSKKVENARDSATPVRAGEPTMTPTNRPDPTEELQARDSRKQEGEASTSFSEPEKQN